MNGILLINKDKGMTSHDVVFKIKKLLNVKKIGHAGTLDPLATGLLVVMLNEATKLSNYLMEDIKEYIAEIVIGVSTDTEDSTGNIIDVKNVTAINDIDNVLNSFVGEITQIPPMYSAIKQSGKKLYEIAREGKTVEREKRNVNIYAIKRLSEIEYANNQAKFQFQVIVSKGTYIRTLCVAIGNKLNYPAHMSNLERNSSGSLNLKAAYKIDDIKEGNFKLIDMLESLKKYQIINVDAEMKKKILNGMMIDINELKSYSLETLNDLIVFSSDNNLLAIYKKENGKYRAERVWN